MVKKDRIYHLDLIRALAILYIVAIRHLDDYAGSFYYNRLDDAITYACLGVFVFISGYLLCKNNILAKKEDILNFYLKRFLRIYPLYLLSLFLFVLSSLVDYHDILQHALFVSLFNGKAVITLWFVSIICVYYLVFPLLVFRFDLIRMLVIFLAIMLLGIFIRVHFNSLDIRFLIYFPVFIFGILDWQYDLMRKIFGPFLGLYIIFFCLSIIAFFYINKYRSIVLLYYMCSSVPFTILLAKYLQHVIAENIYMPIAYASFCMYLIHRVVFYWLIFFVHFEKQIYNLLYLTIVGVPLVVVLAYFLQKIYDSLIIDFFYGRR